MIGFQEALSVLSSHIRVSNPGVFCSVCELRPGVVPEYQSTDGPPPVCGARREARNGARECSRFYGNLKDGRGLATCPYGISMGYDIQTENPPSRIGIFVQTRCAQTPVEGLSLPRKQKKAYRKSVPLHRTKALGEDDVTELLNSAGDVLDTLLSGRVAAYLRSLTHQILTPVQGALSDIEQLKQGDNSAIRLLEGNIRRIQDLSKRTHVLLSEGLEPTEQTLRNVELRRMIQGICRRLDSQTSRKDIEFIVHSFGNTTRVRAVPDLLDLAFSCILENAVKYSFSGFADRKKEIRIKFGYEGQRLQVEISNVGCPITAEEIESRSIFELGYRGEASGDRGRRGTGHGLFLAERIVRAHQGRIEVQSNLLESQPAGGQRAITTFSVYWPQLLRTGI